MRLVIDGKPVKIGQEYKTFRGETVTLLGVEEPRHVGSTGRVYVQLNGAECAFYPSVINANWREDN